MWNSARGTSCEDSCQTLFGTFGHYTMAARLNGGKPTSQQFVFISFKGTASFSKLDFDRMTM